MVRKNGNKPAFVRDVRDITRASLRNFMQTSEPLFYFITIYGANDVMTALTPLFNLIQKSGSEGSPLSQWRKLRPWKMNAMLIAF